MRHRELRMAAAIVLLPPDPQSVTKASKPPPSTAQSLAPQLQPQCLLTCSPAARQSQRQSSLLHHKSNHHR